MTAKMYTVSEVAELTGWAESTIYQQLRTGKLEHLRPARMGNRWRIPKRLVDQMVDGVAA